MGQSSKKSKMNPLRGLVRGCFGLVLWVFCQGNLYAASSTAFPYQFSADFEEGHKEIVASCLQTLQANPVGARLIAELESLLTVQKKSFVIALGTNGHAFQPPRREEEALIMEIDLLKIGLSPYHSFVGSFRRSTSIMIYSIR